MNNVPAIIPAPAATLKEIRMDSARFPRLSSYRREEAIAHLVTLVTQALMYKGMEPDTNKVAFTAAALYEELMQDPDGIGTPALSFEEIRRVIRRSVLGQGTELYGINVSSLYKALADYAQGEGHRAQLEANEATAIARKRAGQEAMSAIIEKYAARLVENSNNTER